MDIVNKNIQRGLDIGKNPLYGGYNLSQYKPYFRSLPFNDFRAPQYTLSSYRDNPFWNLRMENDFNPIANYENIGETLYNQTKTGLTSSTEKQKAYLNKYYSDRTKYNNTGAQNSKISTGSNINWGNVGKTAAGIASMIPENEMTIGDKTYKRGLWDTLDPVYHLADGRESEVGNTLSDVGVSLTKTGLSTGQWYLALAGAGAKILGGLANAGWGIKGNEENIAAVEKSTDRANQIGKILGQVTSDEDLFALSGQMSSGSGINSWSDLYENGWFTDKGTKKGQELINKEKNALAYQTGALGSATRQVDKLKDNAILANFSAYGGPLYNLAMNNNNDMGAIEYGFMSDYLASKKAKEQNQGVSGNLFAGMPGSMFADGGNIHIEPSHRGRLTELKARTGKTEEELYNDGNPAHRKMVVFARNARRWKHGMGGLLNLYAEDNAPLFAFGGDLNTHGSDFPTGLTHIDAGGTHEENPNQGVPMGVDLQGNPNLVEEGEVIYDDYVFSNRISLDDEAKEKLGLKGDSELSYSNAAKKLEKIVTERPNDPISKDTFKAQMDILKTEQERQKKTMEAEKAQEVFNAMSPEEQTAVIENAAQEQQAAEQEAQLQEQLAAQQTMEENTPQDQPSPEEVAAQEAAAQQQPETPPMAAMGGPINKFSKGGKAYRYTGLFGPVVGLGMMSAGIGKPDYSGLDAVVEAAKEGPILSQYRPLGNYMKYTPMDIYAAQAKMNAQARATDRALMNGINPGRYAGLIANGYNSQLASGELFRQALAYNNEQRQRVAEFNRGTDQANADAAMRTSQFNADAINRDKQFRTQLGLAVEGQKLEGNAGWYNSLYGNVNQLFKGLGEYGKEKEQGELISAMADQGIFGTIDPDSPLGKIIAQYRPKK